MKRSRSKDQLVLSFLADLTGEPPPEPEPAPLPDVPLGPRSAEDRRRGLIEQIRRDMAVLDGPPEYCCDRTFYEERIAGCRETVLHLSS